MRGKSAEELIVKIVAVGQNDDSRVFHRRFADDAPLLVNNVNRLPALRRGRTTVSVPPEWESSLFCQNGYRCPAQILAIIL